MSKGNYCHYKAILWKELVETSRVFKYAAFLWAGAMVAMLLVPIAKVVSNESIPEHAKGPMLGSVAMFIPMLIIPMVGHGIVVRSIYDERRKKTIQTLMAQGVRPIVIWLGKVSAAVLISGAVSLIASTGYFLVVKALTGYWIRLAGYMLYLILFVSPIISVSILALVSSCYMVLKQPKLLGFVYVMSIFYGMFYVVSKVTEVKISIGISFSVLAAGIAVLGLSCFIAMTVSRERIASI